MFKHKARNTFYWITWEVNSLLMKSGQFMSYYKRKNFIKKFHKNCDMKSSSRSFCAWKKFRISSTGKRNFWSKPLTLDMYKENYQNLSKLAHITACSLVVNDLRSETKGSRFESSCVQRWALCGNSPANL